MHLPVALFSMLAVALQGVHTPTAETEGVSVDAPSTFVVANRSNNGRMNLIEMVRPPETVDNWSELISVAIAIRFGIAPPKPRPVARRAISSVW